jgi:UDP-N-acetylmuramoylalanine--D-glutamate ligase
MNLKGKRVLIVGFGRTGEAVCTFLLQRGARVKISEQKTAEELGKNIHFWQKKGVEIESGGHQLHSFLESSLIIPSPGVPYLQQLEEAKKKGVPILSEIELASRFLKGKIVGITGTNGKSTTATLTHKIMTEGGFRSHLAGNIGIPLIQFADQSHPEDIYVTELSSFQLKYIDTFRAAVSVFLNVTPDHLDWHIDFNDYYESKKNLLFKQRKNDTAILNRDDSLVWVLRNLGKFRVYAFSQESVLSRGCWVQNGWIILADKKRDQLMQTWEVPLLGPHNRENIMASALVGHIFGIPSTTIKESIKSFEGLEHRLEKVLALGNVEFYNDSKATNVDATLKSLKSFDQPIILILGGRDKGGNFSLLKDLIKHRVKSIILIGEAKDKIEKSLNGTVPMMKASDLREAVRLAYSAAQPQGVVLLAPGCTSFDMFQDFEERGKVFKTEVWALKNSMNQWKD